jgi:uncharacterized glyoxalase superfamily protein PhnB
MRYRDVAAAIDWLCTVFGFETHHIVTSNKGDVVCAHLTLGSDMITVWSVRDSCLDRLMKQPDEIGGAETQSCYLIVENADAHYHNAKAAGADIVLDLADDDHGGRGYSCQDPEGHIWSFGTYDPWQQYPSARAPRFPPAPNRGLRLNRRSTMAAVLVTLAAAIAGGMFHWQYFANGDDTRLKLEAIAAHDRAELAAARAAALTALLTQERGAKKAAELHARQLEEQVAEERRTNDVAERMAKDASEQIAKEQTAKEAAERTTSDTTKELMRERHAKQQAERSAQEALEQLARLRREKEAAERAAKKAEQHLAEAQNAKIPVGRSAKGLSAGRTQDQNTNAPAAKSSEPTIPSLVP